MGSSPSVGAARLLLAVAVCLLVAGVALGQANDYRGLWVGQATLSRVNEVSIPLDEDNVAIAPDPAVATPTDDAANLRLILHVNGFGQVSLLKDVAIVSRTTVSNAALTAESDLALITDETLYGEIPQQPAMRIASAVFDFGDSRATDALDAIRDDAANEAAASIIGASETDLDSGVAEDNAAAAALAAAQPVVDNADAAAAFDTFMRDHLTSSDVDAIAITKPNPATAPQAQEAALAASNLFSGSFYADSRGVDMVGAVIEAAVEAGDDNADRKKAAQAVASSYADVEDKYHRFIAGKEFGDMIADAAQAAYLAATNPAATEAQIRLKAEAAATDAFAEAISIEVARYKDSRATDAVQAVVDAIVSNAVEAAAAPGGATPDVQAALEQDGRAALASEVARYKVPGDTPTPDYNSFVSSEDYLQSAAVAAAAAAEAAAFERKNNPLYTAQSVEDAALIAAYDALADVYADAARAVRTSLPLVGEFRLGEGDTRLTWEIKQDEGEALRDPGLTGVISLPARHPTNPFRHRRHPDHTAGFDITRHIRIDFDEGSTNGLERAGYGVDRITGIYREEVEGLHKPLGPDKNIGLKAEGTFELNRISLIDALNAL